MTRDEMIRKISEAREELKNAKGQRRRQDLRKHIFRMEREIAHYDAQQRKAADGN